MEEKQVMDTTEVVVTPGNDDLHAVVMSRFKNSAAMEHRHLCAVVSAMAEVMKEQAVALTPTGYFAATMSALNRQWESIPCSEYDDSVTTALFTFLAITIPKTSSSVISSKSSAGLKLLVNIIGTGKVSAGGLKSAFSCMASFVRASDTSDWLSIAPAYNIVLSHCLDQRSKVRKKAHECTADFLRGCQNSASLTMGSEAVASLFERLFSAISKNTQSNPEDKSSGNISNIEALQILYFLNASKLILPLLSEKYIGRILTLFKKLLDLEQPFLSRQIFNTLQPLFIDMNADTPAVALSNLLERIACLILDEKKTGDECMVAARIVVKGMERLHSLDSQSCALKVPLVFQSLAGILAMEQEEAVFAAADSLKQLIQSCLDDSFIEQGKVAFQSRETALNLAPSPIERICVTASSLLGYQFSPTWDVCLQVIACLFDKLADASFLLMGSCVQALADLEGLSDEDLQCRKQLHTTIGSAIAAMGPENFLTLLPLNINGTDFSKSRLWLLPILRQNVVGAQMGFFIEKVHPIIQRLQIESKELFTEGKLTASKKTQAVVHSLWALFPAFCHFPSDTARSFGRIARHLGTVLSEEPDYRGLICHGLKKVIRQNKAVLEEHGTTEAYAEEEVGEAPINKAAEERAKAIYTETISRENIECVASFSRNFLPLLFNVFMAAPPEKRGVLQTNMKTRNTAYDTLVQFGHSLKEDDPQGQDGKLIQFFTMIVGCLAGSTPHMRSAAITGLARLIYEFQDLCQTIPELLPSILLLLHTKSREVIKSVLGFLKVVVVRQPPEHLQQHLKSIVERLLLWSDDSKNHFKAKVRVLFEMLVKRCGLQAVSAVTPEQHAKLLHHIRKMKDRKQREKDNNDSKSAKSHATTASQSRWNHTRFFSDGDDEGDSDEDNTNHTLTSGPRSRATTTRSKGRLRKTTKMLPEDDICKIEPLDLLDTQKTRSSLSNNKHKRKNYDSEDFEFDSDGRLIIPDQNNKGHKKHADDQEADIQSNRSGKSASRLKSKVQATKKRRIDTGRAYTGQEYVSKNGAGKGDVKQQGKLEPYAYWPLDPKMLNRREGKKAVARKGLASVVKATNRMKGLTVSEALAVKRSHVTGLKRAKAKHKFQQNKGKGRRR